LGQFGFPWNLTGTVILDLSFASQIIHERGIYFAGFFLIFIFAFLYQIFFSLCSKKIFLAILQSSLVILISFWAVPNDARNYIQKASSKLIKSNEKQKCNFKDSIGLMNNYVFKKPYIGVRIVSTNISQKEKKRVANQETNLINNIKLTFKENYDDITYFIWPETSFGFLVKMDDDHKIISNKYISYISSFLKKDQFFIIGCMRKNNDSIFNSIIIINHKGEAVSHYDKNKLVPFGEFIPFGEVLPFEKFLKFTGLQSFNTFKKSEKRENLECSENEKFKRIFYPLICFEAIFPFKESERATINNSNLILNLSSDAWFDKKFATSQHLRLARVRAIEAKKPLIRLSNGGWDALIDGDGKILHSAGPGSEGFMDVFIK
jgi:apolipoprotein N-acyltransferase